MAGYLEEYGVEEERRGKVVRRIVLTVIVLFVAGVAAYFVFRTYPAKRQVREFLAALSKHDYKDAYRIWGCEQPCRDYSYDKFLEDWGPKTDLGQSGGASIKRARYCDTGVIVTITSNKGNDVPLWYQRSDGTLGFSPWPVCAPHIPAPTARP